MPRTKAPLIELIIAVFGAFAALFGITLFNRYLLMTLPLGWRMVLMVVSQWSLFLVPGLLMWQGKESVRGLGFSKENIPQQLLIGLLLAFLLSMVLTGLPILFGLGGFFGNAYTQAWQFAYEFFYMIVGVALAEELVFRGYLFHKLLEIRPSRWFAIAVSSVLFGLFHIFHGSLLQVVMTALLGFLYCILREKVKGCTLLSLIIAHGAYNGMIALWVAFLNWLFSQPALSGAQVISSGF